MLLALWSVLLSACGGSSSSDDDSDDSDQSQVKQGYFLDSAVAGLSYQSNSYSGFTGENGEFTFKPGESVSFSFNGIDFGSVTPDEANPVITPLTVLNASSVDEQAVANMLVLLQTFDNDQDPNNGISLPSGGALVGFDEFTLNIADSAFQSTLLQAAEDAGFGNGLTLINEDDAKAHFNETLLTLQGNSEVTGTWVMRSGEGDVSALYEFNANGNLTVTEYDACENNDDYWASTATSAANNCTENTLNLQWQQTGNLFSMSNTTIDDTCTALSMSAAKITANCLFTGSGLGYETITLERQLDGFSASVMEVNFAELSVGTTNYTHEIFEANLSGSYQYIENGVAQTGAGDMGDYTWEILDNVLSITGTDNSDEAFALTYNFEGYYNGSWHVSYVDPDDQSNQSGILKANFNTAGSDYFKIFDGTMAIYDATTGECKGNLKNIYEGEEAITFSMYTNTNESDAICNEVSGTDQAASSGSVLVEGGAVTFNYSGGDTQEICWPLGSNNFSDKKVFVMACATEQEANSDFEVELWRVRD